MNELSAHHKVQGRSQRKSVLRENFDIESLAFRVIQPGADLGARQGIVHRAVGLAPAEETTYHEVIARTEQRSVVSETPTEAGVLLSIAVERARQIAVVDHKTAAC